MKQLEKLKNKELSHELSNLISKYKKITHSEKNNSPEKSEDDDFPKKYLIEEKYLGDSSRNNTRKNLYKYLKICLKDEKEKEKLFEKIVEIENELYKNYGFGGPYINRVLEILHNIKDDKNEEFRQNIVDGKISPEELSTMDENDMLNKNKRKEIENKIDNKIKALIVVEEISKEEGVYTCPKCHNKKTTQQELQTRSADEPMTIFITCQVCGNRWKN